MMHQGSTTFDGAKLVWKTWAPLKVKLFLRIAFKERLWTVERRQRHGLVAAVARHLYNQAHETVNHMFVPCPFTLQGLGDDSEAAWRDAHATGEQLLSARNMADVQTIRLLVSHALDRNGLAHNDSRI